ncbi:MAG: DUF4416 family protein [Syntrophobacteraceae bacterium]
MSQPEEPLDAKLIIGLLFRDFELQQRTLSALSERFGPLDFISRPDPFTYTAYYDREMGPGIYRQVLSFLEPVHPETLADIKLFTNNLETLSSVETRRQVNIDPGLLSEERIILATGKNFTHRIYLRNGIYADLTLLYRKGAYQSLPWTYPSYKEPILLHYFSILRQKLIFQRRRRLPYRRGEHLGT